MLLELIYNILFIDYNSLVGYPVQPFLLFLFLDVQRSEKIVALFLLDKWIGLFFFLARAKFRSWEHRDSTGANLIKNTYTN